MDSRASSTSRAIECVDRYVSLCFLVSDRKDYVRPVDSPPPLSETEKEPGWSCNSDYLFVISHSVRDSNVPPAGKVFLFIPAIPLDIALFPVAAIAGLFGD